MPPRRYSPSVHYFRKNIVEAERPVGGFTIKRRVETEVGFLGSQAVRGILGDKREAVYSQPDTGFTIITHARADRLAATFPGTQAQLDNALEAMFRKLPATREVRLWRAETVPPDDETGGYVVTTVLEQLAGSMRRYERHFLYTELGMPWMGTDDRAGSLRVPVYTTPLNGDAERTASALNELIALGDTALVLGELYVSRSPR